MYFLQILTKQSSEKGQSLTFSFEMTGVSVSEIKIRNLALRIYDRVQRVLSTFVRWRHRILLTVIPDQCSDLPK